MFKVNEYFDGNVTSLSFDNDNKPASVGVMAAGNYVFNTDSKEKMTVISGSLIIKLKDADDSITYHAGDSFNVIANSSFDVSVPVTSAYLCEYG
ncbi:MAG: pyrimidine/purine nucleoside phosphorylase [Gammaproteobacteria bacterium]|nr:pyrimidine/purine nucleoside phosphorylase [Gammaproteobacteria bacterium]